MSYIICIICIIGVLLESKTLYHEILINVGSKNALKVFGILFMMSALFACVMTYVTAVGKGLL